MGVTKFTTLTIVIIQIILMDHTAKTQPTIEAFPMEIDLDLTETLDINCTVTVGELSNVAALILVEVTRHNSSQSQESDLAIISDFSNGEVKVETPDGVMANGWFSSDESAYVSLHWDYPTEDQAGIYTCVAEGFTLTGHTIKMDASVQVSAHKPDLSDWQEKVLEMNLQMKQTDSFVQDLVKTVEAERESSLSAMFHTSLSHGGHTYYLSRYPYSDHYVSQVICNMYGGHLAEVNDQEEYSALQTFLASVKDITLVRVFIAGSDANHEGTWTLPSGEPVPLIDWRAGQPYGDGENCLLMHVGTWQMADNLCRYDVPLLTDRFLCEVP